MPNSLTVTRLLETAVEAARLEALNELQILDTMPEQAFDDLAWIAAQLCRTPISLVSLVDGHRQWFKAKCGLEVQETPKDIAFCAHALGSDEILEVQDATLDPRFAGNPLVTGAPHIRFYAGAPLSDQRGNRFGTLCVIDTQPGQLTQDQREGLTRLARRVSESLEIRRQQIVAKARERAMAQLVEALPDAVITCDSSGMLREFNTAARDWHGVDVREILPAEWAQHFDLYDEDGLRHLDVDAIPLVRAWKGEQVREARIVIRAKGQAPRYVSCNADSLRAADGKLLGAVCLMHDVTQLITARNEVLIETQRFEAAFSAASQGMAMVSLEGRWLEANDALCMMFGHTREELLALDFQRLTHPEDLRADLELLADLLAGRRTAYHLDKRYFHRTGRTIHAHLSVSLVRDAKGAPLHFVSQINDLSQRHHTEQRLRESELRLRSVLENSYDAFISVDDTEAVVEWNRAAEATFGWRRGEVLGKPLSDLIVPPRLREAHRMNMRRYLSTGEATLLDQRLEQTALHRGGHEFPVEMTVSAVQVGERRIFNAFLHDISERRASEERLRASEQRLRTVADNVPALIGHIGTDLTYRFVNQQYAQWFGQTADQIIGRPMNEVLRPEHFEGIRPKLEQVLAGEAVSFEMDVVDRDGQPRHMQANYIPDKTLPDGTVHGFHLMVHDVTTQTRLARMLQERALTDDLTGLPNRAAWAAELARGTAQARQVGASVAVIFLDLDGFKKVNDTHGHAAGDEVLREFAKRLRASLRSADFIARLSGDEFVVFLDSVSDTRLEIEQVKQKILRAMDSPMAVNGQALRIRPSIGIAVQSGPDFDTERLMQQADESMYQAKRNKTEAMEASRMTRGCEASPSQDVPGH